ncbi:hypothetical protein ACOCJ4_13710 [Knoellia sp. CPCC 206435]|uniref:hypothetical protein n=1 Tax=Knoellia terrae TaxID=3404797 RepID=UPI003B42F781
MSFGSGVMKAVLTWSNQKRTKAMAPASVLARAAAGMSIEGDADALGLAETEGDGEALLGDADGDGDEIVGVGAAVAPSPPPLQPARASVATVAADTAYDRRVRDFIVRNPPSCGTAQTTMRPEASCSAIKSRDCDGFRHSSAGSVDAAKALRAHV